MSFITVALAVIGLATFVYAISKNFLVATVSTISLKKKHILITGGSKGIGKALALQAAKQGADVTILARKAHQLEVTCEELKKICDMNAVESGTGQRAQWFSLDMLSDPGNVSSLGFGPLNVH